MNDVSVSNIRLMLFFIQDKQNKSIVCVFKDTEVLNPDQCSQQNEMSHMLADWICSAVIKILFTSINLLIFKPLNYSVFNNRSV